MPTLTIDNRRVDAPDGASVLDAARMAGIEIPTLCALPGLSPRPACMVCVVRVNGSARLLPSCATPVADGMRVESETEDVMKARRTAIELLLSEHLGDCVGPCTRACPAHLDTPKMMRQIAQGNFREALITVKESMALPSVLGRICPDLCERSCRRTDGAVSVCQLKRFVADLDRMSDSPYVPVCAPATGKRVTIVGAGPTGLSAAFYLRQAGHSCTLIDENPLAGGMLRYQISESDLPREVLDDEIAAIERLGAQFTLQTRVGRDISLADIRQQSDAVLLATGDRRDPGAEHISAPQGPHGILVDKSTFATSLPAVFAAGGAIAPIRHAVRAVADGHGAARSIVHFLDGSRAEAPPFNFHTLRLNEDDIKARIAEASDRPRVSPGQGRAAGLTAEEARMEAARCLQCSCAGAADCRLRDWATRCGANQRRFSGERRAYARDESHPNVVFEAGKCIACGICVRLAASFGQSFQGHGIQISVGGPFGAGIGESLGEAAIACAKACPTGALTIRGIE